MFGFLCAENVEAVELSLQSNVRIALSPSVPGDGITSIGIANIVGCEYIR